MGENVRHFGPAKIGAKNRSKNVTCAIISRFHRGSRPAQLPGAHDPLATNDLIGINSSAASKVHLNRRLFPLLKLFDHGLEVLQLPLHALMRIKSIPLTPVLTSVAQRVQREQLV